MDDSYLIYRYNKKLANFYNVSHYIVSQARKTLNIPKKFKLEMDDMGVFIIKNNIDYNLDIHTRICKELDKYRKKPTTKLLKLDAEYEKLLSELGIDDDEIEFGEFTDIAKQLL